ncbi:EamA family transporter [Pseudomonas entomophila]|uniref:DMT family transporter n=1 Tax=Pseudomonas entomophila TaxID=312306 RepID=UPI0015E2E669|nr:EamA family transporter [Pseudomonas entomophila]MBA1191260.1 EamA family transporter [Pseudomonas entomophila]
MTAAASSQARGRFFGVFCVLGASVLWDTTGTAATFAPHVSPLAIGAVAMGIGGLLQMLLALRTIAIDRSRLREHWRLVLMGAIAVAIYPLAFYSSMRLAGVTIGTVITIGSAPLLSTIIERVFDGKPLTVRWMIGATLGSIGTLLLCIAKARGHADSSVHASLLQSVSGVLLGLVAGVTYALYSWTAHRLMRKDISSSAAMGATFGLGGLLLIPVLLVTGASLLQSWNNAMVGLYMILVPMFLGYILFGIGLSRITASTATTLSLIEPVVAAALAVVIVGERLPALGWVGAALIVCCLYVLVRQPQAQEEEIEAQPSTPLPRIDTVGSQASR